MTDDPVVQRLDKLIAITQLARKDAIDRARERILGDSTKRAIVEAASDWTTAGELKTTVMKHTKESPATVSRRLAELVAEGVLAKQGAGSNVSYKATGLI